MTREEIAQIVVEMTGNLRVMLESQTAAVFMATWVKLVEKGLLSDSDVMEILNAAADHLEPSIPHGVIEQLRHAFLTGWRPGPIRGA